MIQSAAEDLQVYSTCLRLAEELLFDAKDSGNVLFLHESYDGLAFLSTCIFFPRVSNKTTRGKESQHLRLRIRTTWTWEENHQMQKIVAMCIIHT